MLLITDSTVSSTNSPKAVSRAIPTCRSDAVKDSGIDYLALEMRRWVFLSILINMGSDSKDYLALVKRREALRAEPGRWQGGLPVNRGEN